MQKHCVHSPSSNQASHTNLSNSLVSQYPPDPGEHVLKRSAASTGEQDIPVQWFKFIHPSPKPRMTKTPFQITPHFHGENWHNTTKNEESSDHNSRLVTKNLIHHAGTNGVFLSTSTTPHVDSCSRKLTGEGNTQSTLWLAGEVMKLIQLDTTSLKWIGELLMTQVSSFSR